MSMNSLKLTIGDLMSGKAFDNNCTCYERLLLKTQQSGGSEDSNEKEPQVELHVNTKETGEENMNDRAPPAIDSPEFECVCSAPRLAPVLEFTKSLVSIGKKLARLASRDLKSIELFFLNKSNINLIVTL